jgi:hypothetical protein
MSQLDNTSESTDYQRTSEYIFHTLKQIHSEKLEAERHFRNHMIDYQAYASQTVRPIKPPEPKLKKALSSISVLGTTKPKPKMEESTTNKSEK